MGILRFAQGQLTQQPLVRSAPNSNSVQMLWLSSLPKRMKKIQSKKKALELPHDIMLIFGAQGQITPKSVVGSGRNSNSFKPLCMFLLPARMKKIQSKMNSLEWPQHFSQYKSIGIFRFAQGKLTPQPLV